MRAYGRACEASVGKCVTVRHASRRRHPPPGGSRALSSYPPQPFQCCCDAPLVRSPDPGKLDLQTVLGDIQNGRALFPNKKGPDLFLPRVGLVSRLLLRRDELAFECGVRPPAAALLIKMHGFSKS